MITSTLKQLVISTILNEYGAVPSDIQHMLNEYDENLTDLGEYTCICLRHYTNGALDTELLQATMTKC